MIRIKCLRNTYFGPEAALPAQGTAPHHGNATALLSQKTPYRPWVFAAMLLALLMTLVHSVAGNTTVDGSPLDCSYQEALVAVHCPVVIPYDC